MRAHVLLPVVVLGCVLGCVAENVPPPATPPPPPATVVVPPVDAAPPAVDAGRAPDPADAGAPVTVAPPAGDFYACTMDSDCVAVPKVGCCNAGEKEAVASGQEDAYRRSFTCPEAHPICPMYKLFDTRQPECNNGTHKCEMVPIDKIKCAGFIKNQHRCPDGYQCKLARMPDAPGDCVKP